MRDAHLKYMRNNAIEEITASRIRKYEAEAGIPVSFPILIERIVESVLGLSFDWDEIEENPGEEILGGLVAEQKKILLNEKHLDLFRQKPGLERSTIGHEAGHWDIDIDRSAVKHPTFPGLQLKPLVVHRTSTRSKLVVEVLRRAATDERFHRAYKKLTEGVDAPEVKSAVDRYQSALLMPEWLITEARQHYDFTRWSDLYALADEARVTISNLVVRLQRLDLLFIPEGTKELYGSMAEYSGQRELF